MGVGDSMEANGGSQEFDFASLLLIVSFAGVPLVVGLVFLVASIGQPSPPRPSRSASRSQAAYAMVAPLKASSSPLESVLLMRCARCGVAAWAVTAA